MTTSRPAKGLRGSAGGFTLIETVAVLAILGLLMAVALPRLVPGISRPQLEGIALRVAALLEGDRRAAMLQHKPVAASVDVGRRLVGSGAGGAAVTIPAGVGITSALAATCLGVRNENRIVFLPSGMSCGGTVTLDRGGRAIDVKVNWLTGSSTLASR